MKPLIPEAEDAEALQELGRASVQVAHDLKNQIGGLKLYATFLRKRVERNERPADERETITKLMTGLERAAGELTALVRYGRRIELQPQPGADLARALAAVSTENRHPLDISPGSYEGQFDLVALGEAFKDIAMVMCPPGAETSALKVKLRRDDGGTKALAVIEWRGAGERSKSTAVGVGGVRLALATRTIEAHGGAVEHTPDGLRARLPLEPSE